VRLPCVARQTPQAYVVRTTAAEREPALMSSVVIQPPPLA